MTPDLVHIVTDKRRELLWVFAVFDDAARFAATLRHPAWGILSEPVLAGADVDAAIAAEQLDLGGEDLA